MNHNDLLSLIPEASHLIKLPVSGKEIKVSPIKHGAMKQMLLIVKDADKIKKSGTKKMLSAMNDVLQQCVKSDVTGETIDIRNLFIADYIYMMLYIKEISKGDETKFIYKCRSENCNYTKELIFKLDDCELINEEMKDESNIKINFDENGNDYIIMHVKPFSFNIMFQNAGVFGNEIETGDETTNYYCSFIDAIEDKEGKIHDNIPLAIKRAFLQKMSEADLGVLIKYINKQPMLKWENDFECGICGTDNEAIMDNVMHFFSM